MSENAPLRWIKRHYIWAGIITAVLFAGFFHAVIWYIGLRASDLQKHTFVYQQALAKARSDSSVAAILGTPIEDGDYILGGVLGPRESRSKRANFQIPLKGTKGQRRSHGGCRAIPRRLELQLSLPADGRDGFSH